MSNILKIRENPGLSLPKSILILIYYITLFSLIFFILRFFSWNRNLIANHVVWCRYFREIQFSSSLNSFILSNDAPRFLTLSTRRIGSCSRGKCEISRKTIPRFPTPDILTTFFLLQLHCPRFNTYRRRDYQLPISGSER